MMLESNLGLGALNPKIQLKNNFSASIFTPYSLNLTNYSKTLRWEIHRMNLALWTNLLTTNTEAKT